MQSLFRHTTTFVFAIAIVGSQLNFVSELTYCTEFIQLEDGSMCTTAMVEGNLAPPDQGNHAVTSSKSCCASKLIEANNHLVALVKDATPNQKFSPVAALLYSIRNQSVPGLTVNYTADSQNHSPPISELIVRSSILLI